MKQKMKWAQRTLKGNGVAVVIFWARFTRLLFPPVDGGVQTLVSGAGQAGCRKELQKGTIRHRELETEAG